MKPLLLIAITILTVGCGGKDESTTETKPVEEKVQEVKEKVKTEEPVAEVKPQLDGVTLDKLEEREGIVYLKGSDTPYTGKFYGLHPNGQKATEANYKGGKKEGLQTYWHKNGQKSSEVNYKDGKQEGLNVGWHSNGRKRFEVNYKDGKQEGLNVGWHSNGRKRFEVNYKNGKKDGVLTQWHESGRKSMESHYKDGVGNDVKAWRATGELIK